MLISILRSVAIVVLWYFCSIYSESQTAQCNGCPYNNTCLSFDSSSDNEEECTRYHCYNTSFYQGDNLVPGPYGCRYGGQCRENNEEWQEWCIKKRCIVEGNTTEIQSEQIGCYDVGTCHQHDETWNDKTCQSKRCNGGRIEFKGKGCRDVNGNCHAVGDTGISFYSRITRKTYTCTCTNSHGIMDCRA